MPAETRPRAGGKPLTRTTGLGALAAAALAPDVAAAYIGPGAGLTAIGSVLAFLAIVLLLVAGFVWYPVKRLLRRLRGNAVAEQAAEVGPGR